MNHTQFNNNLRFGQAGENVVAKYMRDVRGCSVLPVYEVIGQDHKGPRFFMPSGDRVAPDMLVFKKGMVTWVEVKRKTVFTWHRISRQWCTGVDKKHYEHYKQINSEHPWDVWLLFLHECAEPDEIDKPYTSEESPTGLFACSVLEPLNHTHQNWGRHGMVYWAYSSLILLASLEDIYTGQDT